MLTIIKICIHLLYIKFFHSFLVWSLECSSCDKSSAKQTKNLADNVCVLLQNYYTHDKFYINYSSLREKKHWVPYKINDQPCLIFLDKYFNHCMQLVQIKSPHSHTQDFGLLQMLAQFNNISTHNQLLRKTRRYAVKTLSWGCKKKKKKKNNSDEEMHLNQSNTIIILNQSNTIIIEFIIYYIISFFKISIKWSESTFNFDCWIDKEIEAFCRKMVNRLVLQ